VTTAKPPEAPEPRTGVNPTCHVCLGEIANGRTLWAHRDGAMRPMHPRCANPAVRRNGIVIK
jgi:hypothetical protein